MSTSELKMKLDLINRISILDDARIIKEIKKLLDFELDEKVYELNQPQKSRIEEARNEYKNAQTLTEEDANNEIDQWLNEK
ncbi:vacuolar-type H+-ATPase subunit H [Chryseobacterium sp. BIGb0186]|uniref:hypothetical protein n=2 Tax=Chryseobacterium TaxID=59732 RepID=UPI000FA85A0D|nr:hypothetical protein [Chryseobacterium scophthalmum]MBM7419921.1 vacuolar-type H+-ATPase subunit H [Chryseobacterium sp. JUb44]MDH6209859.1 vacuolar-type H+-ATPase subunit H [Chryseobacterium sp. BIGb0186]WSO08596.1 hypothetical protein VUJ64_12240 [Chryseobacterium scophthalmum]